MRVVVAPQAIEVAAPLDITFALVSVGHYDVRSDARFIQRPLGREGGRLIVRVTPRLQAQHSSTLKELVVLPPDRISFRHLGGPLIGATEDLHLLSVGLHTQVTWSAAFAVEDGTDYLAYKMHLEHEAAEHLMEIKTTAERRVASQPKLGVALATSVSRLTPASEQGLRQAIELQEEEEYGHTGHGGGVARVAIGVAQALKWPASRIEQLRRAALLHDVGKIVLDTALWARRTTLSTRERQLMEAHVRFGYELAGRVGIVGEVGAAILHHHERWDGQGYPRQLVGEAIPMAARLLFVAEATDSMLRASYRRAPMATAQVADVLVTGAGKQWDPHVARLTAFMVRGHAWAR